MAVPHFTLFDGQVSPIEFAIIDIIEFIAVLLILLIFMIELSSSRLLILLILLIYSNSHIIDIQSGRDGI